jgi:hypothetical protein
MSEGALRGGLTGFSVLAATENGCRGRLWRRKGSACGPLRALAPPSPPRLPDEVFEKKTSSGW